MEHLQAFQCALDAHIQLFQHLGTIAEQVEAAADLCARSVASGGKLMFCGNGGSAADSQHLAAELTGRFVDDRLPLPGLALSTDSSALTCISNDYSYSDVFVRQVRALGKRGDVLVGISTSGNSENVLKAVEAANSAGIQTIGLLGRDGGKIGESVTLPIVIKNSTTARVQEAHIFVGHMLCEMIERKLKEMKYY